MTDCNRIHLLKCMSLSVMHMASLSMNNNKIIKSKFNLLEMCIYFKFIASICII